MNRAGLAQIIRFVIVGSLAALVHVSMVVLLVQLYDFLPLVANAGGFLVSVQVSYWGHRLWTFAATDVLHREAYPKLVMLQISNFCLNELLYFILLSLQLPYLLALLIVMTVLPVFTFLASKFWIFRSSQA
jgi:putative flippase GtrA